MSPKFKDSSGHKDRSLETAAESDGSNETDEFREISLKKSSRHVSRAVIFSFFQNYGLIPLNLLMTWLIARNISENYWGIYIYANVLINGSEIILSFLPPSMNNIILYKIPSLMINDEQSKAKGLIHKIFQIRMGSQLILFLIYGIISFIMIQNLETEIYLTGKCLSILSFIILIRGTKILLSNIVMILKKYKIIFLGVLIEKSLLILGYYLVFTGIADEGSRIIGMSLSFTIAMASSIPLYYYYYYKTFHNIEKKPIQWKVIKESAIFGMHFAIISSVQAIYEQSYYGAMEFKNRNEDKTYYKIGVNLVNQTIGVVSIPFGSILTDLEEANKREEMVKLFQKTLQLTSLISTLLIGILFSVIELYILIIYPPQYLSIVPFIQIFIFNIYFNNIFNMYNALYTVIHLERKMFYLNLLRFLTLAIISIISYITGGLFWLIFAQMMGAAFFSILFWVKGNKYIKPMKIHPKSIFQNIITLTIILIIIQEINPLIMQTEIIQDLNSYLYDLIYSNLNLKIITHDHIVILISSMLKAIFFMLLYLAYVIVFKVFTKNDLDNLNKVGIKIPFKNYIRKILR